ncbi:hypothetical protein BDA99DRAFT_500308 [Phascolomyces articulosus]|uniref:Membrane anchor Opy2 N-terminal domain-containing protein n=1 Tax=Phascolomyces articulosus TaxID=60185 RepID=A0AAD5PGY0_9FUNG|nr:hypothetical protein BDA99DRAFT_500308 [Phascolomyces articulosus]
MKLSSPFKNHSNNTSLLHLLFLFIVILLPILVQAQDCQPSGCVARCNGSCSTNQVCTLGTMRECGVCPSSQCVDQAVLGLPPSSTPSTTANANNDNESDSQQSDQSNDNQGGGSNKGSLIGGLVGGLLGGLLLFACVGFWAVRRFKGKARHMLPFTQQQMSERNNSSMSNHREITSGVIPVAYIPPSPEVENDTTTPINNLSPPPASAQRESLTANANIAAAALAAVTAGSEDPQKRYESKYLDETGPNEIERKRQSKYLSASYESDGESIDTRASIASSVSNNPTTPAKTTYAVQVSRARPTIMRVNQVRISDVEGEGSTTNLAGGNGLSRSGSVRTILTRDDGSEVGNVVQLSRSNTAPAKRLLSNRTPRTPKQQLPQQRSSMVQRHPPRPTTIINTDPDLIEATVNKSVIVNRGSPRSEDDPFHDRHSALIESSAPQMPTSTNRRHSTSGTRHHSNTPTTDSRILGDGEITIYWNNAYDEQQKDDTSTSTTASSLRHTPRPLSSSSPSSASSNPQK